MTSAELACPSCGGELRHIAEYDRYYCNDCGHYAPEGFGAGKGLTCPKCGGVLSFIRDYERYYCHRDHEYMPEEFGRESDVDLPKSVEVAEAPVHREPVAAVTGVAPAGPTATATGTKASASTETLLTERSKAPSSTSRSELREAKATVVYGVAKPAHVDAGQGREAATGRQATKLDDREPTKPRAEPKPSVPTTPPARIPSGPPAEPGPALRKTRSTTISEPRPKVAPGPSEPSPAKPKPATSPAEPRPQVLGEPASPPANAESFAPPTLDEALGSEAEGTEPIREEPTFPREAPQIANPCPTCGRELMYVAQYDRHYCRSCRAYAPRERSQAARREVPACPTCGKDLTFIQQFERHYCYSCKRYAPPFAKARHRKASARARAKRAAANPCPTCGRDLRYVAQYNRYYCGSCRTYAPARVKEVCPNCSGSLTWIPRYRRLYCYSCQRYAPAPGSEPMVSAAAAAGPVGRVATAGRVAVVPQARSAARSHANATIGLGVAATGSAMYVLSAVFALFPGELGVGPTPFVAFFLQFFGVLLVAIGMIWGLWAVNSRT